METKEALEQIITDLKNNAFDISEHAIIRMNQRNLSVRDIIALVRGDGLKKPLWNGKHNSWNFTGRGFADELFTIACTY